MTTSDEFLKKIIGSWEGICRTWFQPDVLADESNIQGEIRPLLGGSNLIRHVYEATIQGRPRKGEELVAFNSVTKNFQVSWIDDFHMNYGIMFSEGEPTPKGFCVTGKYDVAPGEPPWGWKTVFDLADEHHLTITSYNITPDGQEAKAVETEYRRTE